jgi:hypothetical protein
VRIWEHESDRAGARLCANCVWISRSLGKAGTPSQLNLLKAAATDNQRRLKQLASVQPVRPVILSQAQNPVNHLHMGSDWTAQLDPHPTIAITQDTHVTLQTDTSSQWQPVNSNKKLTSASRKSPRESQNLRRYTRRLNNRQMLLRRTSWRITSSVRSRSYRDCGTK